MTQIPRYFLSAFIDLSESFPHWKANENTIRVWYSMLKDIKPDDLARAVVQVANEEAWPSISAVRLRVQPGGLTGEEAWTEVLCRVRRTGEREIMDRSGLPENAIVALEAIGGRSAIRSATMDGMGTMRAHFIRIYEAHEKREADTEKRALAQDLLGESRDDARTLAQFNERDLRDIDDEEKRELEREVE